ncbi:hypothetical protein Tco_0864600, partial [Tanacetum coccineum]
EAVIKAVIIRVLAWQIVRFAAMADVFSFFDSYNDVDIDYRGCDESKNGTKAVIIRVLAWQIIRHLLYFEVTPIFRYQECGIERSLCESAFGPTVVGERLQEQGSLNSLVIGNVPVENAHADSVKTQGSYK